MAAHIIRWRLDEAEIGDLDYNPLQVRDIVVPVDGSRASLDALALACHLARRNKGTVYAVFVIEVARTMALDAEMTEEAQKGEEILSEAERLARSLDHQVSGELLQARDAGHAIVDEAIERGVSAIVMGVSYNQDLGEYELEEAAQYVLKNAPCQVIVVRSAREAAAG
jgi:nucleotide-binding universal stress UspA family protein